MSDVFISYARTDEIIARRVESRLKAAGFEVWRDDQLPAHQVYSEIIEQRLREADAVVVLWSKEATQSQWVRAEADFARNQGKLAQAVLDGTLAPIPFNQIQCADLRGWRGHRRHKGWVKLIESVTSIVSCEKPKQTDPAVAGSRAKFSKRTLIASLAGLMLLVVAAFLLFPRLVATSGGPPRLAVLPFVGLGGSDEGLVDGIWEDTRQALSRNPQLLVLGPNSSEEIAKRGSGAARKAADYLIEASVRTTASQVRINASLVRSKDGAQIWSQTFDRKLDDVFALQSQIAQEIEGRIRGRLARGGGRLPEHIITNGEVYVLYSTARATLRNRDARGTLAAHRQLKQAVQIDASFAPAWALLSRAEHATQARRLDGRSTGKEAEAYARRAIELAPNLAFAHAALGLALGLNGPVAEASLRRAIALDPNDVETLNLLAAVERDKGRWKEALNFYNRAVELEPLWWPAALNRLSLWIDRGQNADVREDLDRINRLGDMGLKTLADMTVLEWHGDLSQAIKIGLEFYAKFPSERGRIEDTLASLLLRLGHDEVAWSFSNAPSAAPLMWRNDPMGLAQFEERGIPPTVFWQVSPLAEVVSRSYVTMNREAALVKLYTASASSPEEFLSVVQHPRRFIHLTPTVAVAMQRTGNSAEAERLMSAADELLEQSFTNGLNLRERAIFTARVRAVQGRRSEAVAALRDAIARGWSPWAPIFKPDIQDDTALALLKDVPQFQHIRTRSLSHLAKERAKLGVIRLEGHRS